MSQVVVQAPNRTVGLHLSKVKWEMRSRGVPTIRVYDPGDGSPIIALEGSHRLVAAIELGLPVKLERLRLSDRIEHDFDLDSPCSVGQIVAYLGGGPTYTVRVATKGRRVEGRI